VLVLAVSVPALIISQENTTQDSGNPSPTRVDETTLLLDGGDASTGDGGAAVGVSPFGIWDLLRMILVLAVVIGLVYAVFYLLKRANRGKFVQNDAIRIVGSQSLPGNRSIYLVEVGSQVFLVGAGGDSVSLISEITDKETVDAMVLRGGESVANGKRSFGELIAGIFRGNQGGSLDLLRDQRERLQRLRQH
jgi:flagellar protein FliO/FliZ